MVVARFEVHLVRLDPTEGHEIQKTPPCVVISPDEMNGNYILNWRNFRCSSSPTTTFRPYPSKIIYSTSCVTKMLQNAPIPY